MQANLSTTLDINEMKSMDICLSHQKRFSFSLAIGVLASSPTPSTQYLYQKKDDISHDAYIQIKTTLCITSGFSDKKNSVIL
jgi:hypothetical protein